MGADKGKRTALFLGCLIAFTIILHACGGGALEELVEPGEPAEPAAPEKPFEHDLPSEQLPVQYGHDSRTELFQHTDLQLQEMAGSVAVFVHKNQVEISNNTVTLNGYTLNEMSELGWLVKDSSAPMCTSELFVSQVAPGFCTGFLVKEDILVTAGHCLDKIPCTDTSIIFGFHMDTTGSLAPLTTEYLFQCEQIIAHEFPSPDNQNLDFAVLKLDRPTARAGLAYSKNAGTLGVQDSIAVIGHPSGIPLKIASNAIVLHNKADAPYFVTNLDTFGSNSGSPVINMNTYQVEGILVRGMTDYVLSGDGSCIQVNRCPESGGANCSGENATKMEVLTELIPDTTTTNLEDSSNLPICFMGFRSCEKGKVKE